MRHSTATALLVLGITHLTDGLKQSEFCFDGCELTLNYVAFTDASTTLPKKVRRCRSIHYASSLYLCISQYCKNDGRDAWLVERNEDCRRLVNETLPPYDIVYDYAPEDVANLRRLHAEEGLWNAKNKTSLSEVVIPDETFFEQAYKTLVRRLPYSRSSLSDQSAELRLVRSRYTSDLWVRDALSLI
jgi:hypothetical protein